MGLTKEEQTALDLHNKYRREAPGGSRPDLVWSNTLAQGALAHARKMAEMGKQQHDIENVRRTGQGENLAWGIDGESSMGFQSYGFQPQGFGFQGFNFPNFEFPMGTAVGIPTGWPQINQGQQPASGGHVGWPQINQARRPDSQTENAGGGGGGGGGGGAEGNNGLSLQTASKMWADEKRYYNGEPIADDQRTGLQGEVGHYTQMVWPEVTKMGIAKFTVPQGDKRYKGNGTYICARYDVCQIKGYSAWRSAGGRTAPPNYRAGNNCKSSTSQRGPFQTGSSASTPSKNDARKNLGRHSSSSSKFASSSNSKLDIQDLVKQHKNIHQMIPHSKLQAKIRQNINNFDASVLHPPNPIFSSSSKANNQNQYTSVSFITGTIEKAEHAVRKTADGKIDFDKYGKGLPDWIKQIHKDPNNPLNRPEWIKGVKQEPREKPHAPEHTPTSPRKDEENSAQQKAEKNKDKKQREEEMGKSKKK